MAWFDGSTNSIEITIDKDAIGSTLTNFPVYVPINSASGTSNEDLSAVFDDLSSAGDDLKVAFSLDGSNELTAEVDHFEPGSDSAGYHVLIPSLSHSEDTTLTFYYNSSLSQNTTYIGNTGGAVARSVWDVGFYCVYHFNASPTAGAGGFTNSALDLYHGTAANWSNDDRSLVAGLPGYSWNNPGTGRYIDTNFPDTSHGLYVSIEGVGKTVSGGSISFCTSQKPGTAWPSYLLNRPIGTGNVLWGFYHNTEAGLTKIITLTDVISDDEIIYLGGSYDRSNLKFVANDETLATLATSETPNAEGLDQYIAAYNATPPVAFNGIYSEQRISNVIRSEDWFRATRSTLLDSMMEFAAISEGNGGAVPGSRWSTTRRWASGRFLTHTQRWV